MYEYVNLEHQELYVNTAKKILNHIGHNYEFPLNILRILYASKITDPEKPTPSDSLYDTVVLTPI